MKDICLMIDYRDASLRWWDWSDNDKEETVYNLFTGERALYTYYKIKNTIFDIYKTLMTDIYANKDVLYNTKSNSISYGDKTTILLDEQEIRINTFENWESPAYHIFKQDRETGELLPWRAR